MRLMCPLCLLGVWNLEEIFLLWLLCISCLSVWNILLNLFLMVTIPVLLYVFCKWGSLVPIHISLPLVLWQHGWLPLLGLVALSLWGVQSRCRRDWPVLPQSKHVTWPCPCSRPEGASMGLDIFKQGGCYLMCFLREDFLSLSSPWHWELFWVVAWSHC